LFFHILFSLSTKKEAAGATSFYEIS